ncbi:rhodanese-like domain-containing protein [Acholeplasma hippikon]|uniref:Thiosulfate sulfurtransferase PspE n=1 Tax=Acholeplasma hippikon TaxID=264636 RepID=A0A449BIE0_9MOLU|nr:rhodanese-like domain-containing protein [Acholeplasma hippikon]VEU82224.1 Thiosulfate sulfurtransferase PspE precursor [Acholeplasma hippikon]
MFQKITTSELEKLMQLGNIKIIDVREKDEVDSGHIEGIIHIPLGELTSHLNKLKKNQVYYIICRTGNRSHIAAEILTELGYKVVNILGGMSCYNGELA